MSFLQAMIAKFVSKVTLGKGVSESPPIGTGHQPQVVDQPTPVAEMEVNLTAPKQRKKGGKHGRRTEKSARRDHDRMKTRARTGQRQGKAFRRNDLLSAMEGTL